MKGLRLGREKTGSSVGKKKRTDKLIKQKNKAEKVTGDLGEEQAIAADYFVDGKTELFDENLPHLQDKLLGCGIALYLSPPGARKDILDSNNNDRWIMVSTIHPRRANKLSAEEHEEILNSVKGNENICAILTGIQYGKPPHGENKPCCSSEEQKKAFEVHCKVALDWKLPLVITLSPEAREVEESNQAVTDCLAWLTEVGVPKEYKIYFSSWVGTPQMALKVLKAFPKSVLGLNGAVTFRASSHLREIAYDTPIDRLLIESDSPNHPPADLLLPHSPWTTLVVAKVVAEQKRMEMKELLLSTNKNAALFFGKTLRQIEEKQNNEDDEEEEERQEEGMEEFIEEEGDGEEGVVVINQKKGKNKMKQQQNKKGGKEKAVTLDDDNINLDELGQFLE